MSRERERSTLSHLWLLGEKRRDEDIAKEDVCPFVGMPHFTPDEARFCLASEHGGACTCFRVKPFAECPGYLGEVKE